MNGVKAAWSRGVMACCQRARAKTFWIHEGVDVDPAVLNQVQREHADLVVLAAIAGHLTAPGEEHEVCGAVPLLDDVQPLVDLAAQRFQTQVSAQNYGLDRLAELGERLVGRVLDVLSGETPHMASVSAIPSRSAVAYLTI